MEEFTQKDRERAIRAWQHRYKYNHGPNKKKEDKVKAAERSRRYHDTHKKEVAEYMLKYFEEHKKEKVEYDHQHYVDNKDTRSFYNEQYNIEHKDERAEHDRRRVKEHPEGYRRASNKRRALKAKAEGSFTDEEFNAKCRSFGNVCVFCGKENIINGVVRPLTYEHVIPITRGGSDWISNILPACKSCNCKKHNKTLEEYLKTLSEEQRQDIYTRIYMAEHPEVVKEIAEKNGIALENV